MNVMPDANLVPAEERRFEECKHEDRCAGWKSEGAASGWITFRLPRMERGRIVVCSSAGKDGGASFLESTRFFFNDKELAGLSKENIVYGKCLEVMATFPSGMKDGRGHCHLGVVASAPVEISHVITQ